MRSAEEIVWLDFETEAIEDGCPLLPEPVGCAILGGGYPEGHYFSWGHPEGNNCTKEEFGAYLKTIWDKPIGTQNGCTFDIPIAGHHFGLPERDPLLTEDTLFLSYLHDPHARSLSLKDIAEDWLGMPPEEQQDLYDWIMANVPECRTRKQCGAYIAKAPGDLVGKYAVGDVVRTKAVYEYVAPLVEVMQDAYDRERRLAPVLADVQNRGVRCDKERLERDYHSAMDKLHKLDGLIREHLNAPPDFNPGSDKELGIILIEKGYSGFLLTPTGKPSMNKESLNKVLEGDPKLRSLLHSRSTYATLTGTFMKSWIEYANKNGGYIHAGYNQVRNPDGFGTRTGRLSSSKPNFQNVPKNLGLDYWGEPFPEMRSYLLPDPGHVWFCADAKNQEPRLAAHFEDGDFQAMFKEKPMANPYRDFIMQRVDVSYHEAKQIFLGLLYAMGAATLADRLGCGVEYASSLRNIVKAAMPDIVRLDWEAKQRWGKGLPIKTLGGRLYYCEPPSNGRRWEYKALNTLIQGSAADQTKEAVVYTANSLKQMAISEDWTKLAKEKLKEKLKLTPARVLGTVHDEINISCPEEFVPQVEVIVQEAINALPCDVPMFMETGHGPSWAEAKPE